MESAEEANLHDISFILRGATARMAVATEKPTTQSKIKPSS
jgi:hypothetical protein